MGSSRLHVRITKNNKKGGNMLIENSVECDHDNNKCRRDDPTDLPK